jgi:hypothetical protein
MRTIFPLMIAVALTASSPALAQNTADPANADSAVSNDGAAADNALVADPAVTADPANDLANVPVAVDEPVETAPIPVKKSGFPWGVLGLFGLLGLIPRKR